MHTQAHTVSFDQGFVECAVVHNENRAGRRTTQTGEQVEKFRSVYAPFMKAEAYSVRLAIAANIKVRIQDPFPCKQKHREPLVAYSERGITQMWKVVQSITKKCSVFVFGMKFFT